MARLDGIKKKLPQYGINENQVKEIIGNDDLTYVIRRMEKFLAPDILHQVLDSCGCLGSKAFRKKCEKIGKELAGKSLDEKICRINDMGSGSETITLNNDSTLKATMQYKDNVKYKCVCSASVKKGVKVSDLVMEEDSTDECVMPLSYCFCCAGSFRRHLQSQLDVELRTKEIVSSPINSKGEKPCEFIFEIVK